MASISHIPWAIYYVGQLRMLYVTVTTISFTVGLSLLIWFKEMPPGRYSSGLNKHITMLG